MSNTTDVSIDRSNNQAIKTIANWKQVQRHVVQPLLREESGNGNKTCPNKRRKFPVMDDDVVNNPTEMTMNWVDQQSTAIGNSKLIKQLCMIFHNECLQCAKVPPEDEHEFRMNSIVLKDFYDPYKEATFLSMTRPLSYTNRPVDCSKSDLLWRTSQLFFSTAATPIDENQLRETSNFDEFATFNVYNETGNQVIANVNSYRNRNDFIKHFLPLQYYKWTPPESILNRMNLTMDNNVSFIYGYYSQFLEDSANFDSIVTKFATAYRDKDDLKKRLEQLRDRFISTSKTIKDQYLSQTMYNIKYNILSKRDKNLSDVLKQLNTTYLNFEQTSAPLLTQPLENKG